MKFITNRERVFLKLTSVILALSVLISGFTVASAANDMVEFGYSLELWELEELPELPEPPDFPEFPEIPEPEYIPEPEEMPELPQLPSLEYTPNYSVSLGMSIVPAAGTFTANNWDELNDIIDNDLSPTGDYTINITSVINVPAGVHTLDGDGRVTLMRSSGVLGNLFVVQNGAELTLEHIIVDGNGGSFSVNGVLLNIQNGGRLFLENGATLQNNFRTLGDGGGVTINNGGVLEMFEGSLIYNNRAGRGAGIIDYYRKY